MPKARDYKIAWFCITNEELEAALAALDVRHEPPKYRSQRSYHFGEIKGIHGTTHNIVVVASDKAGKADMASASAHLRNVDEFDIRSAFLVGIAGGLPHDASEDRRQIYRGDVVVAWGLHDEHAVKQWDLDQTKHYLDMIEGRLHSRFRNWYSDFERKYTHQDSILDTMIDRDRRFAAPDASKDVLYRPEDEHLGRKGDCTLCAQYEGRPRQTQKEGGKYPINVHRGLLMTGDRLVRGGEERKRIVSDHPDALCVDMESAALMRDWHPLIVRGISDYADTHYGWDWTWYAAATAAAVAKDVIAGLSAYSPEGLRNTGEHLADDRRHSPATRMTSQGPQGPPETSEERGTSPVASTSRVTETTSPPMRNESRPDPLDSMPVRASIESRSPAHDEAVAVAVHGTASVHQRSDRSGSASSSQTGISVTVGHDLEKRDRNGATKLIQASRNPTCRTAISLVTRGADVKARNQYGNTALHYSVRQRGTELTKALVGKDPSLIHVTNHEGQNALHLCAGDCTTSSYDHAEVILRLKKSEDSGLDLDLTARDVRSKTVIDCVLDDEVPTPDREKMLRLLLRNGAKVSDRPSNKRLAQAYERIIKSEG